MSDARHMFPAFRVFIFGVEVTDDVLSVSVTHSDSRGPSTAQVVLANKDAQRGIDDRYVITEKDIQAMVLRNASDVDRIVLPIRQRYERLIASLGYELDSLIQREGLQLTGSGLGDLDQALARLQRVSETRSIQDIALTKMQQLVSGAQTDLRAEVTSKVDDVRRVILEQLQNTVNDPLKYSVLKTKVGEVSAIGEPVVYDDQGKPTYPYTIDDGAKDTLNEVAAYGGLASRYPYQVGDSLFHPNDPIRIFYRDPRSSDWYHMFAGFISDSTDDIDANNAKTVTLRAEDVLRSLRYARFTTSPGLIDIKTVATDVDLTLRSFFSDDFTGFSLFEFLFTMVFGFNLADTADLARAGGIDVSSIQGKAAKKLLSPKGSQEVEIPRDGVGVFSLSRSLICFLSSSGGLDNDIISLINNNDVVLSERALTLTKLAQYQAIVDHQVRVTDPVSMAVDTGLALTPNSDSVEDIITLIGEHPEVYPVDGGRLIVLGPATLGAKDAAQVLYKDFKGIGLKTGSFTSRLQKIYDVLERIEFSFYASPKGDLIAEMPLHDFDPVDFSGLVSHEDLARAARTSLNADPGFGRLVADLVTPSGMSVGPFDTSYFIARKDTCSYSRSFADESVRTLATGSWHPLPGFDGFGDAVSTTGTPPGRRLIPSLIPLFGVRHEEVPPTIIATAKTADLLCQFLLNRFNGAARTVSIDALPLLRIAPNRPVCMEVRSCVATCREVTHSITWPTEMSMQLKLDYVRGWDGNKVGTRPLYSYLGGFRANPENYAILLKLQTPKESLPETEAPKTVPDPDLPPGQGIG